MRRIILGLGLLALSAGHRQVGGQNSETTTSVTSTTWTTSTTSRSVIDRADETTVSTEATGKEGFETIDPFQDILFDPSLVVARVNRETNVNDDDSTWSATSNDLEDSSNSLEDLNTQEARYYSEPNWYRRRGWQFEDDKPILERGYNRFLKYPIFSGR